MQATHPPIFDSSNRQSSHHLDRTVSSAANRLGYPINYTEHRAPAAEAAFEHCAGRAMQSLSLPPPTPLPPAPFGRRQEPGNSLAKFSPHFSPGRSEQHSYPSPPMSDSQSPARRSAHLVEPEGHPYPSSVSEARRIEGIAPPPPPPPPALLDPRSAPSAQGVSHQRPLYPGEPQSRLQPLHYQPGRMIESPSYGSMQIAQPYAYGYPGAGVPSYLGSQGQGPGPQGQPTAIIVPPPLRPNKPARRTKAHVASACVNCKKAHLSCDVQRPCGRCVASGKQDTCKDVQHKKRGRPRLRDDKDFGRSEDGRPAPAQLLGAVPISGPEGFAQSSFLSQNTVDSHRTFHPQSVQAPTGGRSASVGSYGGVASSPYGSGSNMAYQSLPVAFLNLDLVIEKSNQAFQDLATVLGDVRGKNLADLIEGRQADILQRIRNELREERDQREPSYMPPITPVGQDPMHSVTDRDVDQVSQGYTDRSALLNFRFLNGQHQSLQTQIRLAKTSLYFVTLVVLTTPRQAGPPLLTQQLAPPTPIHASQTMSAPTTAPVREFGPYPTRPSSSASSAPTSPYFNFNSVRTSLPTISSSTYGSSPSYGYSPTAGPEQGYFPTIQPPSQSGAYPSPYPPTARTPSVSSEALRDVNRSVRLEGLQLPPIRTAPAPPPLGSPLGHEFGERDREGVRRRNSPPNTGHRPDTPETGKRRRLNIHEVLE